MKHRDSSKHGKRYDTDAKLNALREFDVSLAKGEIGTAISERLDISIATINRWRREREHLRTLPLDYSHSNKSINRAIDFLTRDRTNILLRLEALFQLIAWQRWPTNPEMHAPAMLALLLNYLDRDKVWRSFADIDKTYASLILRNTSVDHLRQLCSPQERPNEIFQLENINFKNYTERDFMAQIVCFLLLDKDKNNAPRAKMSLKRAHWASQRGLFATEYLQSSKTFSALWHRLGVASAFYYIEIYHSTLSFDLDPWSEGFNSDIDEMITDESVLKSYLARVKGLVEIFKVRLDTRARSRLPFPAFPATLVSEYVQPTPFGSDLETLMVEYYNT